MISTWLFWPAHDKKSEKLGHVYARYEVLMSAPGSWKDFYAIRVSFLYG
jgi:hypothetical protein